MQLEAVENAALAGLLAKIEDRRIRRKVQKLLQLGEDAVRALGELDVALYLRDNGESQLQIVADAVLSHFRRLLEYLAMVAPTDTPSTERSDQARWNALVAEIRTLQYGLASELRDFERRFAHALANNRQEQAIRDLNDATTGLMDGVFAVMTTVYECFLGYAEPERMVPGHRDTLGKALVVRRALAELRRGVQSLNNRVQDRTTPPDEAEVNYQRIVDATTRFLDSDVFNYLRSDTRHDLSQLAQTLAHGNAVDQRLVCEGFAKYLDSLALLSQRGVLIKHDSDLKTKISGDLDRAIKFANLLPEVACDVVAEAFVMAQRLAGLNDEIDGLVLQWASLTADDRADVDQALSLGHQLVELVRPPPVSRAVADGELF